MESNLGSIALSNARNAVNACWVRVVRPMVWGTPTKPAGKCQRHRRHAVRLGTSPAIRMNIVRSFGRTTPAVRRQLNRYIRSDPIYRSSANGRPQTPQPRLWVFPKATSVAPQRSVTDGKSVGFTGVSSARQTSWTGGWCFHRSRARNIVELLSKSQKTGMWFESGTISTKQRRTSGPNTLPCGLLQNMDVPVVATDGFSGHDHFQPE